MKKLIAKHAKKEQWEHAEMIEELGHVCEAQKHASAPVIINNVGTTNIAYLGFTNMSKFFHHLKYIALFLSKTELMNKI